MYLNNLGIITLFLILSLQSCDECKDISCENDGTCIQGECVCKTGYGYSDCSKQIRPDKIFIHKVELTGFKNDMLFRFDNRSTIDSLADVRLAISTGTNGRYIFHSPEYFENSAEDFYSFSENMPIEITADYHLTRFDLVDWDEDFIEWRVIGAIIPLYRPDTDFPEIVEYRAEGRSIKVWITYEH